MSDGAWIDAVKYVNKMAFLSMRSFIDAELNAYSYSKLPDQKRLHYAFRVLYNYTYKHWDQDINHGEYHFKAGEIVVLDKMNDEWFMSDRSHLKFLGNVWE